MAKTFPIEQYEKLVRKVIAHDGPDSAILSLLQDNILKAYDDKLRKQCELAGKTLDEAYAEMLRRKRDGELNLVSSVQSAAKESNAAFHIFEDSPRGELIKYVTMLPLTRQLQLAVKNKEMQHWLAEDLKGIESDRKQQQAFNRRVKEFKEYLKRKQVAYPISGLQLHFRSDGYYKVGPKEELRERTALWLKIDDGLTEGTIRNHFEKVKTIRSELITFDNIPWLERLPHPLGVICKQSKKFGGTLEPRRIAKSLNLAMTELLMDYVMHETQREKVNLGFHTCLGILSCIYTRKAPTTNSADQQNDDVSEDTQRKDSARTRDKECPTRAWQETKKAFEEIKSHPSQYRNRTVQKLNKGKMIYRFVTAKQIGNLLDRKILST